MKNSILITSLGFCTSLLLFPFSSSEQESKAKTPAAVPKPTMTMTSADDLKWGPIPTDLIEGQPSVEMGGTLDAAVISGDPHKPGPYVLRGKCTDGTKIAPHYHPLTENVTVLQGAVSVGMGRKWDDAKMKAMSAGGFGVFPGHMPHFAACVGDTIFQVHGYGPFKLIFVGPAASSGAKIAYGLILQTTISELR